MGELVFSVTPDLGALVFLASSNLSLLGVAMASELFPCLLWLWAESKSGFCCPVSVWAEPKFGLCCPARILMWGSLCEDHILCQRSSARESNFGFSAPIRERKFALSACRNTELNFELCCVVRVSAFPKFGGMLCSKGFVNALNFERVIFFQSFNNERSFALVSNACFIEPLSMHVYRILFFIEI